MSIETKRIKPKTWQRFKTSCIDHPEYNPSIIIRKSLVYFCKGDAVAAALLSFFEDGHNNIPDNGSPMQEYTEKQLIEGILGIARSSKTLTKSLKLLQDQEAISIYNSSHKSNRTRCFLLHPETINERLYEVEEKGGYEQVEIDRSGYVYLARSVPYLGIWKIGKSIDPVKRIEQLNYGLMYSELPFTLELEHTINCDYALQAEHVLHVNFDKARENGEYFRLTKNDVSFIKAIIEYKDGAFKTESMLNE